MKSYVPSNTPSTSANTLVKNAAGGNAFALSGEEKFLQFLIRGTESNTYYATEAALTAAATANSRAFIQSHPAKAIELVLDVLSNGRAQRRNAALYALALCVDPKLVTDETHRSTVYKAIPTLFKIPTDMFIFLNNVKAMRGHGGQGLQRAISAWYASRDSNQLAFTLSKYQSREGWTHRDVLRIARPGANKRAKITDPISRSVIAWALSRFSSANDSFDVSGKGEPARTVELPAYAKAVNRLRREAETISGSAAAKLITQHKLPREVIPTELLNNDEVWAALVPNLNAMALIRNLGIMTSKGVLSDPTVLNLVLARLNDEEFIRKSKVHPFSVLLAASTYRQGRGDKGSTIWTPIGSVTSALGNALTYAFKYAQPSNKRILLAVDVSGSMSGVMKDALALTYVMLKIEPNVTVIEFDTDIKSGSEILKRKDDFQAMLAYRPQGGGTDVSLPIQVAMRAEAEGRPYDAVIMLTDTESWANSRGRWGYSYGSRDGAKETFEAAQTLRRHNPNVKIVEVQLANPSTSQLEGHVNDLRISGYDSTVYTVIADFIA